MHHDFASAGPLLKYTPSNHPKHNHTYCVCVCVPARPSLHLRPRHRSVQSHCACLVANSTTCLPNSTPLRRRPVVDGRRGHAYDRWASLGRGHASGTSGGSVEFLVRVHHGGRSTGPLSGGSVAQTSAGADLTKLGLGRDSVPRAPFDAKLQLRGVESRRLHRCSSKSKIWAVEFRAIFRPGEVPMVPTHVLGPPKPCTPKPCTATRSTGGMPGAPQSSSG